jgi:hypothetical protein
MLVIGNGVLRREDQNPALELDYKEAFELEWRWFARTSDYPNNPR